MRPAALRTQAGAAVMMLDDGVAVPQDAPTQAASRLVAIHEHLRLFYPDPRLTPAKTADALQISVRYLHKLMIQSGRSFREQLTRLRLEACRAALSDPFRQGETIAEIAYSAGFNDLSQFNRHFRAAFGVTPSRARTQAIGILDNTAGALAVRPKAPSKSNGRPPETVQ